MGWEVASSKDDGTKAKAPPTPPKGGECLTECSLGMCWCCSFLLFFLLLIIICVAVLYYYKPSFEMRCISLFIAVTHPSAYEGSFG